MMKGLAAMPRRFVEEHWYDPPPGVLNSFSGEPFIAGLRAGDTGSTKKTQE